MITVPLWLFASMAVLLILNGLWHVARWRKKPPLRPMTPDGRPISREEVDRLYDKAFR